MITSLSWKNIFRSKRRSFTVVGAIAIGVWALIFMIGFYNSFYSGFSKNAVQYDYSHIQIHNPQYLVEPELKYKVEDMDLIVSMIESLPSIKSYSPRQKVNGMIASTKTSAGVQIYAIDPGAESATTLLETELIAGTYFSEVKRNPVLVGKKMAEKLKLKVRSKVVLTFQDIDANITSAAFRVEGIFDSKSPRINEGVVYVAQTDLSRMTGTWGIHEIGVLLTDGLDEVDFVKDTLALSSSNTVRTYKEIAPEFNLMEESSVMTKQILTVIIMMALLFGIINTMLMAVLERTREIGMLRSVGMHRRKVFAMIILETCFLGGLGGPLGLLLGYLTISWLGHRGLDLSAYGAALSDFGYDSIFYPELETSTYPFLMVTVVITAFIGAIYPAIKAIRLNPLEAIRKI